VPRPRKHDPTIPAYIDQSKLPKGVYWDRSGSGRWYIRTIDDEGRRVCKTIAGRAARLSELHDIAERNVDEDKGTVDALMRAFRASIQYKRLAKSTQKDYDRSQAIVSGFATKDGGTFGKLQTARLSPPIMQRLVDKIGEDRPTTGLHVQQYLRRVFRWGIARNETKVNPMQAIEPPRPKPKRVLPKIEAHAALLTYASERGALPAHTKGSVAPYIWTCMELAYLCHMRGIEILDLRESNGTDEGLLVVRRKGSDSTLFEWSPRLRAAWGRALAIRDAIWSEQKKPIPIRPEMRAIIVTQSGEPLTRSGLDTAWQRFIHAAMREKIIGEGERFSLHPLKRGGITARPGRKADKKAASGHKTDAMIGVYDMSVPVEQAVDAAITQSKIQRKSS
jgi:integrase